MLFDSIRNSRKIKLAVLFGFAAAAPLQGLPRENPEITELRMLADEYGERGPMISPAKFERFTELMERLRDQPGASGALSGAGLCAHGSGGSSGGIAGAAAAACPIQRRRIAKGDLSHLLAINHWI